MRGVLSMSYIEIGASSKPNMDYHVCVSVHGGQSVTETHISMTRDELKELRNMMHNALLDLNQELNYEG